MPNSELRQAYVDLLMEQVRSCHFPSPTMMSRIEQAVADRASAEDYVRALLENLQSERFPSPMMLQRVSILIDQLDRAG